MSGTCHTWRNDMFVVFIVAIAFLFVYLRLTLALPRCVVVLSDAVRLVLVDVVTGNYATEAYILDASQDLCLCLSRVGYVLARVVVCLLHANSPVAQAG